MTSPTFQVAQLLRTDKAGVTISQLRKNPAGVDLGPLQAGRLPERLFTKSKRIEAAPALVLADLARLEATQIAPQDGELVLIGRRHQRDNNSWMHNAERLTRGKPRHHLLMHPDDLESRGISDGSRVTVSSRVGSVEVEVKAVDDLMPGVVSLPHGHQKHATGMSRAAKVPGVSINDLTDPERLDVSGNAALNGVPVEVTPA
jgi:anaerobic selenocysteine-containing dehydrogenase